MYTCTYNPASYAFLMLYTIFLLNTFPEEYISIIIKSYPYSFIHWKQSILSLYTEISKAFSY